MTTTIKIRPAARGGKFLGHDAAAVNSGYSAMAAILDIETFEVIDAGFVNANPPADPGPPALMEPISRSEPFVTDPTTVSITLKVDIDRPTTFLIAVAGPLSFAYQDRVSLGAVTVLPGINIGDDGNLPEGLVFEIPGLCISDVHSILSGNQLSAFATVTMMCGCKISTAPPPVYWPPTDFDISLVARTSKNVSYKFPMSFDTKVPSSFSGSWANPAPEDTIVEAWISASQPKLGNQGTYMIISRGNDQKQDMLIKKISDFLKQDKK
ncbi:MAG: hypothetical protein QM737_18165 [Ferruginibacter sp.]